MIFSPIIGLIVVLFSGKKERLNDIKIARDAGVISDEQFQKKVKKVTGYRTEQEIKDTRRGYLVAVVVVATIILFIWLYTNRYI